MEDDNHTSTEPAPSGGGFDRRRIFTLAAGGAVAAASGVLLPASPAGAHGTISSYPGIGGQPTVYEGTGARASFGYRPSFHDELGQWLDRWYTNTPTSYLKPMRIWTLGAHYDGRYSEAHNAGRGFDLTRIYTTINGSMTKRFDANYGQWRNLSGDTLATVRRRYWATSASLHYHFRNVLTYLYNSAHWNHIHIDNLVSGTGYSTFAPGSGAQVQHVRACCRYIWGKGTSLSGGWTDDVRQDAHEVMVRIGKGGNLGYSQSHWLAFNLASMRKGYGRQAY